MNISELYATIARTTTRYTFTHPVAAADLEHVKNELAGALGASYPVGIELTAKGVEVEVATFDAAAGRWRRIYHRVMLVR